MNCQPLYHGTDLRILRMSKEERLKFSNDCLLAIDYMWQFIKPLYEEKVIIEKTVRGQIRKCLISKLESLKAISENDVLHNNIMDAILCNIQRLKQRKTYSYDHTYLTAHPEIAASYACASWKFGEVGQIAYRFYEAIEIIKPEKWLPSLPVVEAIEQLKSFVGQQVEPVIVEVYSYDIDYLYSDSGDPLTEDDYYDGKLFGNFYYAKEIELPIVSAIPLQEFVKKNGLE